MRRLWAPVLLILLLAAPFVVSAQTVNMPLFTPGWHIVPDAHELDSDCPVGAPLGFAGVLQLIQNVMNASISLGVLICVIVITFAGILWLLTPTNPENHSQAKKVLTNAVVGMLIVLVAWIGVDFVMKLLYSGTSGQEGVFGPWNEILTGGEICVTAMDTKPLFDKEIDATPGQGTDIEEGGRYCGHWRRSGKLHGKDERGMFVHKLCGSVRFRSRCEAGFADLQCRERRCGAGSE